MCLVVFGVACVKQWGRTDIPTQASSSRLGENSRSSPWFYSRISLRRRVLVLSDVSSRSSENDSPKRVLEENCCSLLASSSRRGTFVLGEKQSRPSEKGPLRREFVQCSLCHCCKSCIGENA